MAFEDVGWLQEHTVRYLSDPVRAHDWDSRPVGGSGIVPTLLLKTTGRRSGEVRCNPLLYQPCGEGFVIVASRGGSHRSPAWYHNLAAEPECEVQVGRFAYRARAVILTGESRDIWWAVMARFWPDYETYQARTARRIPVVKLCATACLGNGGG